MRGARLLAMLALSGCGSEPPPPEPNASFNVQGVVRCRPTAVFDGTRGCVETGPGEPLRIRYRDEMGSFVLMAAAVAVDRTVVFDSDDETLLKEEQLPIFDGRFGRGRHVLQVTLRYRGDGAGVFSYLKDYRLKVTSSCTFDSTSNTEVWISGIERGGPTTPLEKRPGVHYDIHYGQGRRGRCIE
jgi:hypothetical protein